MFRGRLPDVVREDSNCAYSTQFFPLFQEHSMRRLAVFAAIAIFLLIASQAKADISVCNDFRARIHVAFAYQHQRSVPASGWWTVEPNVCQNVDFSFQGATLYYAADSDDYKQGAATSHDHWGNKIKLFVGDTKFDFDDAQSPRRDATTEVFSLYEIPQQFRGKPVKIIFHLVSGKTNITITTSK
jgi:uncharacterized membrane protein